MTAPPKRIQRSRAKGWRMPPGAVYVGRQTKWGNPFTVAGCRDAGYQGTDAAIAQRVTDAYSAWLGRHWRENWDGPESASRRQAILHGIGELRGRDLVCWCPVGSPCHGDVLLRLANGPVCEEVT